MSHPDYEWQGKGGTLSDKTAQKEFVLTDAEIVHAIRAGKLQYRQASICMGTPSCGSFGARSKPSSR